VRSRLGGPVALAAAFAISTAASAQPRLAVSAEVTYTGGVGRGGEYTARNKHGARAAVSVRSASRAKVTPYIEVATHAWSLTTGYDLTCPINAQGQCIPNYPDFTGPELLAGMLWRPQRKLELRSAIGLGGYRGGVGGARVGGATAAVDGALFVTSRWGVVAGVRALVISSYRGEYLSSVPVVIGVRWR
jgi:hypothetical protein